MINVHKYLWQSEAAQVSLRLSGKKYTLVCGTRLERGVSHTAALLIFSIILPYYIHTTAFCALAGYIERTPSFYEESVVTWNCEWRAPSLAEKIHAKILGIFRFNICYLPQPL